MLDAGRVPGRETPRAKASGAVRSRIYGKLERVDKNGVIMTSDDGKRLAWRFKASVLAEAARFKPGDPLIVIYR
jgi:hypothetical protein